MAKSGNQKQKLLVLRQLLLERTDEEHPMTVQQMIGELERWGIQAERKSLYDDLEQLRAFGLDVQCRKGRAGGWFVGERDFELPELKLLVDAVQSSKFITRRKSDALIRKLEGLASVHQARQLQRQVYVAGRVKTMNESIYYNVDELHAAVGKRRAVSFLYFDYNSRKEKVLRREGARYTVSPCGLVWDNENYYLVGWDHDRGDVRHYRVDKMSDLTVTESPLEGDAAGEFDMAGYAKKHFGMFSGTDANVTLRCREDLAGVVLDRFGREAMLVPGGDGTFTVTVEVVVSPQFWGWLFGLGDGVELLAPAWAAEEYRKRLSDVAKLYEK
ncbi:MAG: helix-turn-helix transcriptional regulator [Oscillospiraceae bacterium]